MAPSRQYSEKDMSDALENIKKGKMTIGKASKHFKIPKMTLSDRVNKRWKTNKIGRKNDLTDEQEKALVYYIKYMASIAHPLTVAIIKQFAWVISKRNATSRFNPETGPGHTCWDGFRKRHKADLTLRRPDKLDRGRKRMANEQVMRQHFELLEETLEKMKIKDKPERIFNCDESGIPLDVRTGKVVVERRSKQAYPQSKGSREHITAHIAVCADGTPLPPFLIFEKSFPSGPYARLGPDNALYGVSPNGYMDSELFRMWIEKLFIPRTAHIPKPILLICDVHGSHLDVHTIDILVEHNIHLYCLPPHTTNVHQPLDVACFGPMKVHFSKITDYVSLFSLGVKQNLNVCKRNFTPIFKDAYDKTMSIAVIKNGFRKCGIYPFHKDAIDFDRLMPNGQKNPGKTVSTPPNPINSTSVDHLQPNHSTPINTLPGCSLSASEMLLQSWNIPSTLVSSFIFPKTPEKNENKTRAITKARVLTSEESQCQLREKVAKNKTEEEAKIKRKEERERKKWKKKIFKNKRC